jgi:hypothetical protein
MRIESVKSGTNEGHTNLYEKLYVLGHKGVVKGLDSNEISPLLIKIPVGQY